MNCPVCSVPLQMTDRSGVEIDYCPTCRGVWLDRGELDKIIDRSESGGATASAQRTAPAPAPRQADHHHGEYRHKKRRESFLGDLFDL